MLACLPYSARLLGPDVSTRTRVVGGVGSGSKIQDPRSRGQGAPFPRLTGAAPALPPHYGESVPPAVFAPPHTSPFISLSSPIEKR